MALKVQFEIFRSDVNSWQNLFEQAANFATLIEREKIINISHSADNGTGIVTVWYWEEKDSNILGLKTE